MTIDKSWVECSKNSLCHFRNFLWTYNHFKIKSETNCVSKGKSKWVLKKISRDFPGGPVVRIPHFQCRGCWFDPWSGNLDSTHYTVVEFRLYMLHSWLWCVYFYAVLFHASSYKHHDAKYRIVSSLQRTPTCYQLYCLPTSSLSPGNYWSVFHLYSFVLLKVLYKWDCYSMLPCEIIFCLLSAIPLRSILVFHLLSIIWPFLLMEWYCIMQIHQTLFFHSPSEGDLGCFHFLAIRNRTTMNIPIQLFMWK